MKHRTLLVAALLAVLPLLVAAQEPAASPSPSPAPPAPAGLEERVAAAESTLSRLLRTNVSGYVQARGTYQDRAVPESNLFVRRARLNLRHSFERGRFALSFDGGLNTVTVKDAFLDLFVTQSRGQRQGATLRAGQFFRPFGFEVERGSPDREFPERPIGWALLFPGNRDQGFDLSAGLTPALTLNVALVNGGGTSTSTLSFRDGDDHKDLMARVRYALFSPRVDLAASLYRGRQTIAATPTTAAVSGDRHRYGFAANVYDLVGGTLRAEFVGARDLTSNLGPGPSRTTAAARAWYVSYVRPLGQRYGVGTRYDEFDPDIDDQGRPGGDGEQKTLGLLASLQLGDPVRLTLTWERVRLGTFDRTSGTRRTSGNIQWTFQAQYRF